MEIQSIKQRFGIIGHSPLILHAIEVATQVAPTDLSVLISGESGTGKENFSKIIHQLSHRKHNKFIAINCGAIPDGTIDSELFGHEKGSFTGAFESRQGYFEVVNGGTIFLDEIGELPLGTQARLLRVLENGEYIRVGASKIMKTNVRIVAATNIDLMDAVNRGRFRKDLYYRLNTVPIEVPPLRDRGEDIYLLFRKFTSDFSEKYRSESVTLDEEAKKVLLNFRFPGNIRQLKNICEQLCVLEKGKEMNAEMLKKFLPDSQTRHLPTLYRTDSGANDMNEREILYKFLVDMKKDISDLKKIVFKLAQMNNLNEEMFNENEELFAKDTTEDTVIPQETVTKEPIVIDSAFTEQKSEKENLLISDNEKDLIEKALSKNSKRRNKAAKELGISERTLYRKLKEYDLE